MATTNFEIRELDGELLPIQDYDSYLTVKELISMVVEHLEYPLLDNAQKEIEYFLINSKGERLSGSDTLAQAGVMKDEVLALKASTHVVAPDKRRSTLPPPARGTVNVYVTLMDVNRTELETFGLNQRVGQVLNEIVRKYKLPERDEKLKEGKMYELLSKSLGEAMHEGMTLSEAKIPNQDTFIVSTKEIPG
jgi:uncharacterized ubiquitin-like protein YukD